jgi:hypothetical protein
MVVVVLVIDLWHGVFNGEENGRKLPAHSEGYP